MVKANTDPSAAQKLILWPDGTWCWHDDFKPADYTHMSDDYETIDLSDGPSVQRLAIENPDIHHEIEDELS